jgi:hypothetical protein
MMKRTKILFLTCITLATILPSLDIQPAQAWGKEIKLGNLNLNHISRYYRSVEHREMSVPTEHPGDDVLCKAYYQRKYPGSKIYGRATNSILGIRQGPDTTCYRQG